MRLPDLIYTSVPPPISFCRSQFSSVCTVHYNHEILSPMEHLSTQLQDKLSMATQSLAGTRKELEHRITILCDHQVRSNNQTLLEMKFQLAGLYDQQNLDAEARSLYRSVSTQIIRIGITQQWDYALLRHAGFVLCNLGHIDLNGPDPIPEELEQKRIKMVRKQRWIIDEHIGAPENDLQRLTTQFELAELCFKGNLSDKEEASKIYKHICAVAFTEGIPDARGEQVPTCQLEETPWFPKSNFAE